MPWHRTELAPDETPNPVPRPVVVGGRPIILTAWGGRWFAFEDRCSHAGCAFSEDGEIDGFHAICNCHGSEFDFRTGRALAPPAREPIATFPVRIEAGLIEVEL